MLVHLHELRRSSPRFTKSGVQEREAATRAYTMQALGSLQVTYSGLTETQRGSGSGHGTGHVLTCTMIAPTNWHLP